MNRVEVNAILHDISQLSHADLKKECQRLGLEVKGNSLVLSKALRDYYRSQANDTSSMGASTFAVANMAPSPSSKKVKKRLFSFLILCFLF